MYFAQFFALSTGYIKGSIPPQFGERKPIEVCGDRGVIILDGRQSIETMHNHAKNSCAQRGFVGYTIHKGETFSRSTAITQYRSMQ